MTARVAGGHPILTIKQSSFAFGAFHLPVGTAVVWLDALKKKKKKCSAARVCLHSKAKCLSFQNFCAVHETVNAHYLQPNDVGQIMSWGKAILSNCRADS